MIAKTKKDFEKYFRAEILPLIKEVELKQGNGIDACMRREEWNNLIDMYIKDRQLPRIAENWIAPW